MDMYMEDRWGNQTDSAENREPPPEPQNVAFKNTDNHAARFSDEIDGDLNKAVVHALIVFGRGRERVTSTSNGLLSLPREGKSVLSAERDATL